MANELTLTTALNDIADETGGLTATAAANLIAAAVSAAANSGNLTLSGDLDVSGNATVSGYLKTNDILWVSDTGDAQMLIDSGPSRESRIVLRDSTSERWRLSMDQALGDDFIIGRAPAGSLVANALRLDVDTGDATFEATVTAEDLELGSGGPTITTGSATPEGAVTAPIGSTFHRTDGGAGTSFYVKESGAGNTGWVAK